MTGIQSKADQQVLAQLGERIDRRRLDRNLTQAQLAQAAGVSKSTVERLQGGESTQLTNFIRILRALDLLDRLDALVPAQPPSPIEQLKLHGKRRRRASSPRKSEKLEPAWTWNDGT